MNESKVDDERAGESNGKIIDSEIWKKMTESERIEENGKADWIFSSARFLKLFSEHFERRTKSWTRQKIILTFLELKQLSWVFYIIQKILKRENKGESSAGELVLSHLTQTIYLPICWEPFIFFVKAFVNENCTKVFERIEEREKYL